MQRIRSFNSIATRAFKAPVFNNNMVKRNIVVNAAFNKAATDAHPAYTAKDALSKSCYLKIDYKIDENATVFDAMNRMAAYHIGCLAVTDSSGDIIGVVSERDYLCKVALLGRNSKDCTVSSIATHGASNLVVADSTDDIETCLEKVLAKDIRHLLIRDTDSGKLTALLSIKDLVKVVVEIQRSRIAALRDISVGGLSKRENMLNHEI